MNPKKVLLLMNSHAGLGAAGAKLFDIVRYLTVDGCEVTVYPLLKNGAMSSEEILRTRGADFDVIACYGGDPEPHDFRHARCGTYDSSGLFPGRQYQ